MNAAPPRIASLVPSATETLVALGLAPWLVARTGFCIHPAAALADVPKVGGTKDVNITKLRRLAPTHVVLNVDENRRETAEALREFVPQLIVTHPSRPDDNAALFEQLSQPFAELPGVHDRAQALNARWQAARQACSVLPRLGGSRLGRRRLGAARPQLASPLLQRCRSIQKLLPQVCCPTLGGVQSAGWRW